MYLYISYLSIHIRSVQFQCDSIISRSMSCFLYNSLCSFNIPLAYTSISHVLTYITISCPSITMSITASCWSIHYTYSTYTLYRAYKVTCSYSPLKLRYISNPCSCSNHATHPSFWFYLNQMHNNMPISLYGSINAPLYAKQCIYMQLGQRISSIIQFTSS